jgi:hypothetical protein
VQSSGPRVTHTWTEPGDYAVHATAFGLDDLSSEKICNVHVTGHVATVFTPAAKRRLDPK